MTNRRTAALTLDHIWALATITLVALRVQLTPIAPHDFWWHLATGRLIAQTGHIPTVDQFSYLARGQPYFNQPWLAQLVMYGGFQLGGVALLALLQAAVIAATFALLLRACWAALGSARLAAPVTLAGALVAMDNWQVRPQTYALPLFVGALCLLARWRATGRGLLWLLPLLMLAWVNLHGTFTLLLGLIGCYWLGGVVERWRQPLTARLGWGQLAELAGWGVASLAATLLNPRGGRVWGYVFNLLGNRSVSQLVTEWASPLREPAAAFNMIFWALLLISLALLARYRRRLSLTDGLLFVVFTALALQSGRNILWWGSVAALVVAQTVPPALTARRIELAVLNRLLAGLLAGLLVATLPWWKGDLGLPPSVGALLSEETPVAATAQLAQLPAPQRLFHELGFGSYLIWARPTQPVFVDPRIELYPLQQWHDYIALGQGQQVDALAARYGFDGWLVSPITQPQLVAALSVNPRWELVIQTPAALYFAPRR